MLRTLWSARERWLAIWVAAIAAGCMVGPDYKRPAPLLPEAFKTPEPAQVRVDADADLNEWWKRFNDPKLDELVERAQKGNISLMQAGVSIAQYRSGYGISYSQLFPSLDLGTNYNYSLFNTAELGADTPENAFNQWGYGVRIASWEIDLFGKIRRGMEASQARLQASVEGWRLAIVSLRAEVATSYLTIRTLQAQRDLAVRNVDLLQQIYDATKAKYKAGTASQIDLSESAARLAVSKASVPKLEADIKTQCNGLSVLLGEAPGPMQEELAASGPIPLIEGETAIGIPSDLLRRRADVLQAERLLMAATADIGVAEAGYYPDLRLNGTFGIASTDFSGLGDISNQTYTVGPSLTWNFFNGGMVTSQVQLKQAVALGAALQWRLALLNAASQVQSALDNYAGARLQVKAYTETLSDTRNVYDLALSRYKAGTIDVTKLLSLAQYVLEAESGYAQARGLTSQNLVGLYRSLGGGWESASLPAAGEDAFDKDGPDMWKTQPKLPDENPAEPAEQPTQG
jgi:NodT family efflux transporter outer membrane factor (OMF) lipoprotein